MSVRFPPDRYHRLIRAREKQTVYLSDHWICWEVFIVVNGEVFRWFFSEKFPLEWTEKSFLGIATFRPF